MYDDFSSDYDRFVNWPDRLAVELPFIERQLQAVGAHRVLDAACGTGRHAIALAQRGYQASGADLSAPMIERARENAAQARANTRFETAGFGELAARVGNNFDALLCLGNSLPHVLNAEDMSQSLADFVAVLRPGGLLLIQNRNFDAVLDRRERWMGPQGHREGGGEWLFVRFYDFNPDGTLTFNMLTLQRDDGGEWKQQTEATRLLPWLHVELQEMVAAAGFGQVTCYGNMTGDPFNPKTSDNLIVTALKVL